MDINKLSVGTEIAVPKREFMSDRQKFDDQQKKYIYHKVLIGETLSSIAETIWNYCQGIKERKQGFKVSPGW